MTSVPPWQVWGIFGGYDSTGFHRDDGGRDIGLGGLADVCAGGAAPAGAGQLLGSCDGMEGAAVGGVRRLAGL